MCVSVQCAQSWSMSSRPWGWSEVTTFCPQGLFGSTSSSKICVEKYHILRKLMFDELEMIDKTHLVSCHCVHLTDWLPNFTSPKAVKRKHRCGRNTRVSKTFTTLKSTHNCHKVSSMDFFLAKTHLFDWVILRPVPVRLWKQNEIVHLSDVMA